MRRALATASTRTRRVALATSVPPARPVRVCQARSRAFTQTSSPAFFFRRPVTAPTQIVKDVVQAAEDGRTDVIAKLYPALVDAHHSHLSTSTSDSKPLVTHRTMHTLMRAVAKSQRLALLLRMFHDLGSTFDSTPTALDHHLVVQGLVSNGKMLAATKWLESMRATYGLAPHVSDCNVILQGWRRKDDLYEMRKFVQHVMRAKFNLEPNVVTYNTFISATFESGRGTKLDQVRKLVDEMQNNGVEPDRWTETALLTGYLDAGEMASAKEMRTRLYARLRTQRHGGKGKAAVADTAMVNALLKYEARVEGFEKAVELAQRWRVGQGIELDLWTLNSLLVEGVAKGLAETAEDGVRLVERLEDLVEVQADKRTWSVLINEVIRRRQARGRDGGRAIEEALELYYLARDRSIEPDATMIHPLVETLLSPQPTPESFETAKSLYEDLSTSSHLSHETPPTDGQPVHLLLLRACAAPSIVDLVYARQLIADMKRNGIKLEPATCLALISLLMRASSSHEEAFSLYDELRALDPSILSSAAAYNETLSTFLSLKFPPTASSSSSSLSPPAPTELAMEFISDMRKSRHPANSATYAILLTYYSRSATSTASTSTSASTSATTLVHHLHSLIKLDTNLDPDSGLFNALMAAYSRVGAYDHVYRIFDSMVVNNNNNNNNNNNGNGNGNGNGATSSQAGIDHRSLSIVLDTCGHDRSLAAQRRGERIWHDAKRGRFAVRPNKKNWDTWVECLARWGRIDEAEQVVFDEMGDRADGDTFQVLIKFARAIGGENKWERVRTRVFDVRPDLAEVLGDVGAKSKAELLASVER